MNAVTVSGLYIYPIKSCRGIALNESEVLATGLAQDRRWMVVNEKGTFVTQREQARLALIVPELTADGLLVRAADMPPLAVRSLTTRQLTVTVWRDAVSAFDEGDEAAAWLSHFLGLSVRLVRFDDAHARLSNRDWTGEVAAYNRFSDGFPLLVIANASLAELNTRLPQPLPMHRFRPNVVLDGLPAYGEDEVHELRSDTLCVRLVKPCTRCKITTIDPVTGIAEGTEPLSTLMKFRRNPALRGVIFGQNAIVVTGVGGRLRIGQALQVTSRS